MSKELQKIKQQEVTQTKGSVKPQEVTQTKASVKPQEVILPEVDQNSDSNLDSSSLTTANIEEPSTS